MIEFSLPDDHPLVISLEKMMGWLRGSDIESRVVGDASHCDLSLECLQTRIEQNTANYCRMARFTDEDDFDFSDVEHLSAELYEERTGNKSYTLVRVAKTWYPPGEGYLGWHIDRDGDRLYSAFAEGESFFRYRDPDTQEIVTSYDDPGWNFRIFTFDANNPMWHCVRAKDLRVSVGYRFVLQEKV